MAGPELFIIAEFDFTCNSFLKTLNDKNEKIITIAMCKLEYINYYLFSTKLETLSTRNQCNYIKKAP